MNMISEEVLALEPDIIAWRRHMHQNPELSFQEVHTTAYLTEELKKRGSRCLTLEVRASNTPARALYESLGFVLVGTRRNYYHNPKEDALILRKEWEI